MKKDIVLTVIVGVFAVSSCAGLIGVAFGSYDAWTPRSYVTTSGNCWVKPQGDPLYDKWYAQEVNPYNCDSQMVQSQSRNVDARTREINVNTNYGVFGVSTILLVVVTLFGLFVFALVRGAQVGT